MRTESLPVRNRRHAINSERLPPGARSSMPTLAAKILSAALQEGRRAVYLGGGALNRGGDDGDLLASLLPVVLLDGLAHAGQRLDAVARVEAGRVNLVLEPGAARQARVARHRALDAHQNLVEFDLRLARAQTLLCRGTIESRPVVLRALL